MKKIIIAGLFFIVIGFLTGNIIFTNKKEIFANINNKEIFYFLQEGIYSDKDILENDLSNITKKVIEYTNGKFYVYIGITKDKNVAKKIEKLYQEKGINVQVKEKNINNDEFSNNVTQFDLLINATNEIDEILTIEEVVLANYEELIKNDIK